MIHKLYVRASFEAYQGGLWGQQTLSIVIIPQKGIALLVMDEGSVLTDYGTPGFPE